MTVRIATRGSRLALWQANAVRSALEAAHEDLDVEVVEITTQGDRILDRPLAAIGGKGLFVKEIEQSLLDGSTDIAVHSAKDLPADMPPGLTLGAVLERAIPNDVLVSRHGHRLDELPPGARVGTSSLRRRAMLLAARPDLEVANLRGNVPTRLRKVRDGVDGLDAAVLAYAGIHRLDLDDEITEVLGFDVMLPAVGQGVVAVQCREGDERVQSALARIHHPTTAVALTAERALLATLEGSCHVPVGALARVEGTRVELTAAVVSTDGTQRVDGSDSGSSAEAAEIGVRLGRWLLDQGADAILVSVGGASTEDRTAAGAGAGKTGGLAERPVIVTRSRGGNSKLASLVLAHGGVPLELPMIEFEATDPGPVTDALERLDAGDYDWLVFTSQNGVRYGLASLDSARATVGTTRIATVGPATADALRNHGVRADLVPAEHTSEGLLEALTAVGVGNGTRVLLICAETTRGVLEAGLEENGATVDRVVAYRTVPARAGAERLTELLARRPAGFITFASSSAVRAFEALEPDHVALGPWTIACIGPITANAAREAGLHVAVVPDEVGLSELVLAMVEHHQARRDT